MGLLEVSGHVSAGTENSHEKSQYSEFSAVDRNDCLQSASRLLQSAQRSKYLHFPFNLIPQIVRLKTAGIRTGSPENLTFARLISLWRALLLHGLEYHRPTAQNTKLFFLVCRIIQLLWQRSSENCHSSAISRCLFFKEP